MAHGILRACYVSWLLPGLEQPTDIIPRNIPSAICAALPEDEQVMLETGKGP
jgi:hypothetical protein